MSLKKILFFLPFFLFSCKSETIKVPEKLLSEAEMQEIIYDLALLNAAKNIDYQLFAKNALDMNALVYKENGVDSLQFSQNMIYYASKPKKYEKMIQNVVLRLQKDSISLVEKLEMSKKSTQKESLPAE